MNLLSLTGLGLDWFMTRNWLGVILLALPGGLLATLLVMAAVGSRLPAAQLAREYVFAGESQISDNDWRLPSPGEQREAVPRFAQALFLRAQELRPGDPKTLFFIANARASQGASAASMNLMKKLAPDDRLGFEPAHAWTANEMLFKSPTMDAEQLKLFRHHLEIGTKWEFVPPHLLATAASLAINSGKQAEAMELMQRASKKDDGYELPFMRMAAKAGNLRLAEKVAERAQPRLEALIEKGAATAQQHIDLADVFLLRDKWEEARSVLEQALETPNLDDAGSKKLKFALSEVYRLRFEQTLDISGGDWKADVRLLDRAMRVDPANPRVAETVAKLARIGGERPPELLLKQLSKFLAEGTATPVTHAWIAEAHILRGEYRKAVQHLNSVLERVPDSPHSLNNLAYALVLLEESTAREWNKGLQFINRAIQLQPRVPDFHDTKATLLVKLGRMTDAIAAYETALELQARPEFHDALAVLYKRSGSEDIAAAHAQAANEMRARMKSQQAISPSGN